MEKRELDRGGPLARLGVVAVNLTFVGLVVM